MKKQIHLNVLLKKNRNKTGTLRIEIDKKPVAEFKVLGRGSKGPGDTQFLENGNTPTGNYNGNLLKKTGKGTPRSSLSSYGPWGAVHLTPLNGNGLIAEKIFGRAGLLIHGGALGGKGYWRGKGALKATLGCLRLSNTDMKKLMEILFGAKYDNHSKQCVMTNTTVTVKEY